MIAGDEIFSCYYFILLFYFKVKRRTKWTVKKINDKTDTPVKQRTKLNIKAYYFITNILR